MDGLTNKTAKAIEGLIKAKFNNISLKILGIIPNINKEKNLVFTTSRSNLISLFLQALGSRDPNKVEENTLKVLLRVASGYIDGLRDRTSSKILNDIDAYFRSLSNKDEDPSISKINQIVEKEMDKAGKHLNLIANSESNKALNTGTALQISRMAEERGEEDPVVFFVVHRDERNHPDTLRLHLLPDGITPRVWKLSELGSEYHKTGDSKPKIQGTHPFCRCKLTYLSPGFSFNEKGLVIFKSLDWDEFKYQRDNFEMPKDKTKK